MEYWNSGLSGFESIKKYVMKLVLNLPEADRF